MRRWICGLAGILLLSCVGAPQAQKQERLFLGGPEFRTGSDLKTRAVSCYEAAVLTEDPDERVRLLEQADIACAQAQLQYEHALKVYSHHQRDEIEFQMDTVHNLRLEIQRERWR